MYSVCTCVSAVLLTGVGVGEGEIADVALLRVREDVVAGNDGLREDGWYRCKHT